MGTIHTDTNAHEQKKSTARGGEKTYLRLSSKDIPKKKATIMTRVTIVALRRLFHNS
jgi:hypothetical protein